MTCITFQNQDFLYTRNFGAPAIGPEAQMSWEQQEIARAHYVEPYSQRKMVIEFYNLVNEWQNDTFIESSMVRICMHPAYQKIIGMGKSSLPLIIRELRREPGHWFWALFSITGVDPVSPNDRGNIQKMTTAWIQWAEQNGY